MFRRRPFRRRSLLRRRPPRRPPLPPRARRALLRANSLLTDGRFAEAADIFERMSEETKQRGMPVRAADLALQASRARFAADDVEGALERIGEALRLLVRGGRAERVPRVLARATDALREKGYDAQADQLEREAAQMLEEAGLSLDEVRRRAPHVSDQFAPQRGSLPARCGGCGAPLVPDEVEWHDAYTAECLYCGTVVKAA